MEENWLAYWRPVLLPFLLLIGRVFTKVKLAEYPWATLASDLCYVAVTFYLWALAVLWSGVAVCSTDRWFARGDRGWSYIVLGLIVNFMLSFLLYPMKQDISGVSASWLALAFATAIGSPLYFRIRL